MKRITKTILVSAFLAGISPIALAAHFYVGGTAGVGLLNGTYKTSNTLGQINASTSGGNSLLVGALAGVDNTFENYFYTAFEINALYDAYAKKISNNTDVIGGSTQAVTVKNNFLYGASAKFGRDYTNFIPYVLAGVEAGQWTMNLTNAAGRKYHGIAGGSSTDYTNTLWGPKIGIGIRFRLTQNLSADFQYAATWFGSVSTTLVDPITGPWNHKTTIQQESALLALTYSFV